MIALDFAQLPTFALDRAQRILGLVGHRERAAGAPFVADSLVALREAFTGEELRRARRVLPHTATLVLPINADAPPSETERGLHRLSFALAAIRDAQDGPLAGFFNDLSADVAQLLSERAQAHGAIDNLVHPWIEEVA